MGLAARGSRKLGETVETIEDAEELAQVRRQARQVNIKALSGVAPKSGEGMIIELPLAESPKVLARIRQP